MCKVFAYEHMNTMPLSWSTSIILLPRLEMKTNIYTHFSVLPENKQLILPQACKQNWPQQFGTNCTWQYCMLACQKSLLPYFYKTILVGGSPHGVSPSCPTLHPTSWSLLHHHILPLSCGHLRSCWCYSWRRRLQQNKANVTKEVCVHTVFIPPGQYVLKCLLGCLQLPLLQTVHPSQMYQLP